MKLIFGVFILFCLNSCIPKEEAKSNKGKNADLITFFKGEMSRLNAVAPTLKKSVYKNGVLEKKILDSVNFEKELEMFLEVDLNKSAWKNSFELKEGVLSDTTLKTYTCKDKKVRIRKVKVYYSKGKIVMVTAFLTSKNNIYNSFVKLKYELNKGYEVVSGQKVRWMDGNYFVVNGNFYN